MWGTSWRQRLRLAPLFAAVTVADRLAALLPARANHAGAPWPPGVTVVIPERDAPAMLGEALASLAVALPAMTEPLQIVVVANGAPRASYAEVESRFPDVEWVHSDAALGFAGAIERGLATARHGATYLLNNDMTVEAETLAALLPLRGERTFAIGSQIFQQDATGRREETGFTDWYADQGGVHLYHAPVPALDATAAHLCASGGAALFRTSLLRRYLPGSRAYDPFYWEDVEWGVRAWRDGYEVLFCPRSRVAHRHRATTARFYEGAELARIVERNRLLFDLRHGASSRDAAWLLARACNLPYASQRELSRIALAAGVLGQRIAHRRKPQPIPPPSLADAPLHSSYSFRLRKPSRRRVLFVSPFAVFPPRHGGARRIAEFVRGQKEAFDVALVSDEASLYDARSFADFDGLCGVRLVQRNDVAQPASVDLAARTHEHCHPALRTAVSDMLRDVRPDVVVVEHAELAPLVALRTPGIRWVLDLHDAYAAGDFASMADAHRFSAELASYDALVVCSQEDRALVAHRHVECIANGATVRGVAYQPSASAGLLFVGPFRYAPNRDGILCFLREAWPFVRAAVPEATLTILGGDESLEVARANPTLSQVGVHVLGHRDDVPRLLAASALAINPLSQIRGSAVKLVETLAAGRVCVSTAEGARGFAAGAPDSLVIAPSVAAMAEPVVRLLRDAGERHRLERPAPELDAYEWHHSVARQRALFEELLGVMDTYDRIARFYDVDMGQNMRFDDVAFYAHQCERTRGPVLELGCGNGRILLPLVARGLDAVGVDASAPMLVELKRKAATRSLPARTIRADVRHLPLRSGFATVLCPYSLVTYMTTAADAKALVDGARAVLAPRGTFVIDAFVPREVQVQEEFQPDYRRPFGAFTLARWKRIQPGADGTNRIERRYEVLARDGKVVERIDVAETIRPCAPEVLRAAVSNAGLASVIEAWDYGTRPGAAGAQFFTIVARAP